MNIIYKQFIYELNKTRKPLLKRSLLNTIFRVLLASVGSYATTAMLTSALALTLPNSKPDAVLLATMLSFIIFSFLVIISFKINKLENLFVIFLSFNALAAIAIYVVKGTNI